MAESYATADDCRKLFELMGSIKDLAPWNWMEETDVFGVQNPDTGAPGFVSVMGRAGEHYAIAVYVGARGLHGFWGFQQKGPNMQAEDLLTVPQLQASFEDRSLLQAQDRKMIKALGLTYRGRNAWPLFRSYRPGYYPWFVDAAEARFLGYALEQLLDVAPRSKADSALLAPKDKNLLLVRVRGEEGESAAWADTYMPVPPPPSSRIQIPMDTRLLQRAKKMPKEGRVEADLFIVKTLIQEHGERPYLPYVLLMVEARSGYVLGGELLKPVPSLEEMWGDLPLMALEQMARLGVMPTEVLVRSEVLFHLLQRLGKELGIRIKHTRQLPELDKARRHMEHYMAGRFG